MFAVAKIEHSVNGVAPEPLPCVDRSEPLAPRDLARGAVPANEWISQFLKRRFGGALVEGDHAAFD